MKTEELMSELANLVDEARSDEVVVLRAAYDRLVALQRVADAVKTLHGGHAYSEKCPICNAIRALESP